MIHPNVSQLKNVQLKSITGPKTSTRENSFVQIMPEEVYFKCIPCSLQFDSEELLQQDRGKSWG